ncbi:DsbA family protein [Candidatus Protochlamydia phocaeensis]|uniref:DsbA family protein n=1 Tax=Candidatus Protochlamydia phocaeensis TaxID=1414722 RepID=UPI0008392470|nr:thioredoxin domain-containing protein [Candidatus Protochlamydia phocaeensis]
MSPKPSSRWILKSFFFLISACCLSFAFPRELWQIYQTRLAMAFGEIQLDTEVYVFTDWQCANCAKLDAVLKPFAPDLIKKAKLYFVDIPAPATESLTRANESFLLRKDKTLESYFKLRQALFQLATATPKLSEVNVKEALEQNNLTLEPINDDLAKVATTVFDSLIKSLKVSQVPTIVIYNLRTHQQMKIEEMDQMKPQVIEDAIERLRQPVKQTEEKRAEPLQENRKGTVQASAN